MTRFLFPLRSASVVAAVLAICVRLVVPAWMPAPTVAPFGADLVALLGEHALCLAGARGDGPPINPQQPAQNHDAATCCLFHASLGAALPPAPATPTPAAFGTRIAHFSPATAPPALPATGTARARAPPPTA